MATLRTDGQGKPKEDRSDFARILNELLLDRGIAAKDYVARLREAGVQMTEPTLSRIRSGISVPKSAEQVRTYCDLLGVPHETLLGPYRKLKGLEPEELETVVNEKTQLVLRSFLLQAEVRLSSLYRTATVLLGASALMLVLPLFYPAGPAELLTALFRSWDVSPIATICLGGAIAIAFAVPLVGFVHVIGDLLGFFFTANRFGAGDTGRPRHEGPTVANVAELSKVDGYKPEVFNPRLTLHGLAVPNDVLSTRLFEAVEESHQIHREVLIPSDKEWQDNFKKRINSIFKLNEDQLAELNDEETGPGAMVHYARRLAVSRSWPLISEAGKMQLLLARHILVIRVGLLRFIKALLLVPVTAITVLIATSLLSSSSATSLPASTMLVQMIGVYLLWAPLAIAAVGAPVRWIFLQAPASTPKMQERESEAKVQGPEVSDVYDDPRMVRFENGVVFLACVNAALVVVAAIASQLPTPVASQVIGLGVVLVVAILAWVGAMTFGWRGRLRDTPEAFRLMWRVGRGN